MSEPLDATRIHAMLDRAGVPEGTIGARIGVLWGDREELVRAREWWAENFQQDDDYPDPADQTARLERIRDWGDSAWHAAGLAEERRHELLQQLRLIGGLLHFEGNVKAALQIIEDTLTGKPDPLFQTVAVDPSFADWTPNCHSCEKPIGNWANCWMLPAGPHEDDPPDTVCFVHRNCNPPQED